MIERTRLPRLVIGSLGEDWALDTGELAWAGWNGVSPVLSAFMDEVNQRINDGWDILEEVKAMSHGPSHFRIMVKLTRSPQKATHDNE